jgi:hypothetical protein
VRTCQQLTVGLENPAKARARIKTFSYLGRYEEKKKVSTQQDSKKTEQKTQKTSGVPVPVAADFGRVQAPEAGQFSDSALCVILNRNPLAPSPQTFTHTRLHFGPAIQAS